MAWTERPLLPARSLTLLVVGMVAWLTLGAADPSQPFYVYKEFKAQENHFVPSGWMGDWQDLSFEDAWTEDPHGGATCIRITYSGESRQGKGWAGIYWQHPENNWGAMPGVGLNLAGYKRLTFWARGETGHEVLNTVKVGGISGTHGDSASVDVGPIHLTKEWKQYTASLEGKDLGYVIGALAVAFNRDANPEGVTFYLDEIRFE